MTLNRDLRAVDKARSSPMDWCGVGSRGGNVPKAVHGAPSPSKKISVGSEGLRCGLPVRCNNVSVGVLGTLINPACSAAVIWRCWASSADQATAGKQCVAATRRRQKNERPIVLVK